MQHSQDSIVTILARTSPLDKEPLKVTAPWGLTIAQIMGENCADDVKVALNGEYIPREHWDRIAPKPTAMVTVYRAPQGGGGLGGILSVVAMIAIAVYAPVFFTTYVGLSATAATIATALTMIAIGSLIAPAIPNDAFDSNAFSGSKQYNALTGSSNGVNKYGVIPKNYGDVWMMPPHAALPYSEAKNEDQYSYVLLCLGYAGVTVAGRHFPIGSSGWVGADSLDLTQIKIGDTTLNNFTDYELQVGYSQNLFASGVDELGVNGGLELNAPLVRTTSPNTTSITLDIVFPQGLYSMNSKGSVGSPGRWSEGYYQWGCWNEEVDIDGFIHNVEVCGNVFVSDLRYEGDVNAYQISYAPTGTTNWTSITHEVSGGRKDPFASTVQITFPTAGQYDVRVTLTTANMTYGNYQFNDSTWSVMRSRQVSQGFNVPNVLVAAMKMKATDQLNGNLDAVTFRIQGLSNPRDIYLDVLQGVQCTHPVPNDQIDFDSLNEWGDWCTSQGLSYNWSHNGDETILQRLQSVCAAGFAAWDVRDGKFGVVTDLKTTPVAMVTPRNSTWFSVTRQYVDMPHAFRVRYLDRNTRQEAERVVYVDGYNESNATKFEVLDSQGIADSDHAYKYGRYHLAQALLRPEQFTFTMGAENIVATRGDVVRTSYDVMAVGIAWGRIRSYTTTTVTLDDPVPIEAGKSYALTIRHSNGLQSIVAVTGAIGFTQTLNWSSPPINTAVEDLVVFGESSKMTTDIKITSITPNPDMSATLTGVNAAIGILNYFDEVIPPFDAGMTTPLQLRTPSKPVITSAISDESGLWQDAYGSYQASIRITYSSPSDLVPIVGTEIAYTKMNGTIRGETKRTNTTTLLDVDEGAWYEVRVTTISEYGRRSPRSDAVLVQAFDLSMLQIIPTITTVDSGTEQLLMAGDGSIVSRIYVAFNTLTPTTEVRYRVQNAMQWEIVSTVENYVWLSPVLDNSIYEIQARGIHVSGYTSDWSTVVFHTVIGKTEPPNDVSTATVVFEGSNIIINWSEVPDLDVYQYEVRKGTTWSSAEYVARVNTTQWIQAAEAGDNITWLIKAIDTSGNYSINARRASITISPPMQPVVTQQVIDNNVLLRFESVAGTLPIAHYRVSKGAEIIGNLTGQFTVIFERDAGSYTYNVKAVDIAGNESSTGSVTVSVSQPPDYVLNVDRDSIFDGVLSNGWTDSNIVIVPVNETQTWQQYLDSTTTWSTLQAESDAGFTNWLTPHDNAVGSYVETYDYGATLGSSLVTITPTILRRIGGQSVTPKIETSDDGITWLVYNNVWSTYATNFRYVRFTGIETPTDNKSQTIYSRLNLRLDSKVKSDAMTGICYTSDVNGTPFTFNTPFVDVVSIVVTPMFDAVNQGKYAVVDFVDTPYPTGFSVYLYNADGVRVNGKVSIAIRGY